MKGMKEICYGNEIYSCINHILTLIIVGANLVESVSICNDNQKS